MPAFLPFTLLAACRPAHTEPIVLIPLDPLATAQLDEFTATLHIDPQPSGKKFQGVWLEREDGERWLIDYRPRDCWQPFNDTTVAVTGSTYEPHGQSISATHFQVASLQRTDEVFSADLIALGPQQTLTGTLHTEHGAPGSKSEGASWATLVTQTRTWMLYNPSRLEGATGTVTVEAREVAYSRYVARADGPTLCILNVRSTP